MKVAPFGFSPGRSSHYLGWIFSWGMMGGTIATIATPSLAQSLIPDQTLGAESSQVLPSQTLPDKKGTVDLIVGGATRQNALFHSFSAFGINPGQRVYFTNPLGIQTIFSRVTGPESSQIFGTLGVAGSADLFLLNPQGILFGQDARLDIAGSFYVSTADKVIFSNGQEFSARQPQGAPLLQIQTFHPRLWYGSLEASLINQGSLQVGRNLGLGGQRLVMTKGSQAIAGQDLLLQGQQQDLSSGYYQVGGYWFNQDLLGQNLEVIIPHSSVIISPGDVHITNNYEGDSLYILAGGSITADPTVRTITFDANPQEFVTRTLGNGQTVKVRSDGQAHGDFRSGLAHQPWFATLQTQLPRAGFEAQEATGASIVLPDIDMASPGGQVLLQSIAGDVDFVARGTAAVAPELLGNISIGTIDTSLLDFTLPDPSSQIFAGTITLATPQGSIQTQDLSTSLYGGGDADTAAIVSKNGGLLELKTGQGSITTGTLDTSVTLIGSSNTGNIQGGSGGHVVIRSGQGNLTLKDIFTNSITNAFAYGVTADSFLSARAGGSIVALTTQGHIATGDLVSQSSIFSYVGSNQVQIQGADGGSVLLSSDRGSITTRAITTDSLTRASTSPFSVGNPVSGDARGGAGGSIVLRTGQGAITTQYLGSQSHTSAGVGASQGGHGGDISLTTGRGNITLGNRLDTWSLASAGDDSQPLTTGNGGSIRVASGLGQILNPGFTTLAAWASTADSRHSGSGGSVFFQGSQGLSNYEILTLSALAKSGDVTIQGLGDFQLTNVQVLTSQIVEIPSLPDEPPIRVQIGQTGQSGNVTLASTGSLTLAQSLIQSSTQSLSPAGDITLTSQGPLLLHQQTQLTSNSQSQGSAGQVRLSSATSITLQGEGTAVSAATQGAGRAGDLSLRAPHITLDRGSLLSTATTSAGGGGNITLAAGRTVTLQGGAQILASSASSGDGGRITLQAEEAAILGGDSPGHNTLISAATQGSGRAGDLSLRAPAITLDRGSLLSTATTSAGGGGNITLDGRTVTLRGGAQILASSASSGDGGRITLQAEESAILGGDSPGHNTLISAATQGAGRAGDLSLRAPTITLDLGSLLSTATTSAGGGGNITLAGRTVTLRGGAQILASSAGAGDGGQITLQAGEAAILGGDSPGNNTLISVETRDRGNPGSILLQTPRLTLSHTAQILATAQETASGETRGGTIALQVDRLDLAGTVGIFAETQGNAAAGTLRLTSYSPNAALVAQFAPGAQISASTSGSGQGGDIWITAPRSIRLGGAGKVSVETSSTGKGGNIYLIAPDILLTDGLEVSASTLSPQPQGGSAGDLFFTADSLTVTGGAIARTNTLGSGAAGNIKVTVGQTLRVSGGTLEAITRPSATGPGGNVDIDPIETIVDQGGRIAVDSQGSGTGGNIRLLSGRLTLNQGTISASTRSSNGGNITLTIGDLLLLQNHSVISTEAGTAGSGGNGGNLSISAQFIIALPGENVDLIANAFQGQGGNITLDASGIFGFRVGNTNTPRSNNANNLTASSRFGTSDTITAPTVNPSQGLGGLVVNVSDRPVVIDRRCTPEVANTGRFIVVGRGGLAMQPHLPLDWTPPLGDLRLEPGIDLGTPPGILGERSQDNGPRSPFGLSPNPSLALGFCSP